MEEVEILIHCATDICRINGKLPTIFASVKSEDEFHRKVPSQSSTTVAPASTNPQWAELISYAYERQPNVIIYLTLVDNASKTICAKFRIPSSTLKPFTEYHLQLIDQDCSCYVSIRKKSPLTESKSMEIALADLSEPINETGLNGFVGKLIFLSKSYFARNRLISTKSNCPNGARHTDVSRALHELSLRRQLSPHHRIPAH